MVKTDVLFWVHLMVEILGQLTKLMHLDKEGKCCTLHYGNGGPRFNQSATDVFKYFIAKFWEQQKKLNRFAGHTQGRN